MPFPLISQLIFSLLSTLEQIFLHLTHLPHPLTSLSIVTDFTRSKSELIAENALLRHQLLVLQRQIKKPRFTRSDRLWILVLASRLPNWRQAVLILKPDTLLHWHRQGFKLFWRFKTHARRGRPRLSVELIALIQQMAKENHTWGAERIHGELLKLGVRVAKHTIQTYIHRMRPLRAPSPDWSTFLKNHAQEVWACDFLSVIDLLFRQVYVFFIVELGSRRVVHFGATRHPTDAWVAQQLREATPYGQAPRFLLRDNDRKYGAEFIHIAKVTGIEVLRTPFRAPRANAICERFLKSVRNECLDHMMIWSERQLYRVVREYVQYFNQARPHQGIGQKIPKGESTVQEGGNGGKIIAFPVLNGLHHDYRRVA